MKYKAAVFDLDGTVLDTLDDLADALNFSLAEEGFPVRSWDEVREFVGNGIRKLIERAVPAGTSTERTDAVHRTFTARYSRFCCEKTRPYPGIDRLFLALREQNTAVAVLSNKDDAIVKLLCDRYYPGLVGTAVGARDGVAKKPAPDAVFDILGALGVRPCEAVYIGDSDVDFLTARSAGTDCVLVSWGFRPADGLRALDPAVPVADSAEGLARLILDTP